MSDKNRTILETFRKLMDAVRPERQWPIYATIVSVETVPGKNIGITGGSHTCTCQKVLDNEKPDPAWLPISNVEILRIWGGMDTSGIYGNMAKGTPVIVGFVDGDVSKPFLMGIRQYGATIPAVESNVLALRGSTEPFGVVTGACINEMTGKPFSDVSVEVKASK